MRKKDSYSLVMRPLKVWVPKILKHRLFLVSLSHFPLLLRDFGMAGFAKQPVAVSFDEKTFHINIPTLESENWVHNGIDVVNVAFGVPDNLGT